MEAPWKSFVFDGVKRDNSDFAWKYDDKDAEFSNEFYQLNDFSSPFVGVLYYRSDDVDISGTWFVKGEEPGNYIGIVFGFQSARKFFLVQWRREHKAYLNAGGLRGLHIKAIHTSKEELQFGTDYDEMLWHTGSQTTQSSLLWYDRNKIPWEFNQAYRWSLRHRPSIGVFDLSVYRADKVIIRTGPISYNRILGGSFGVYAFRQPDTYWSNIKYRTMARENGAISLATGPSKIPLSATLPSSPNSLLISVWFTLYDPASWNGLRKWKPTFNHTILCTEEGNFCFRLVFDSTVPTGKAEYQVSFTFGKKEKTFTPSGYRGWTYPWYALEKRERNYRTYSMFWVNLAIEYVLRNQTARFYVNGNLEAEVGNVAPPDFSADKLYLGDKNFSSPVKIDEVRIVKGRLETPQELGTFISDPELEKYKAQDRVLLWYNMNEHKSSDTLLDKSGKEQNTKLEDPSIRRTSRSESFLYNLQYNKNYQTTSSLPNRVLQRAEHGDLEREESEGTSDFETVTQLFSTKPGVLPGQERKRRKKRHAKMHQEL